MASQETLFVLQRLHTCTTLARPFSGLFRRVCQWVHLEITFP